MAKSTSRTGKAKASVRSTKTTEVEIVDESSGLGFDGGVAIVTALILIAAFLMVDHELGALGSGMFFKAR